MNCGRLARVLGCVAAAWVGHAARADTVIDFEAYFQGTTITDQYKSLGITFTGASVLSSPTYNYVDYPTHSGHSLVYNAPPADNPYPIGGIRMDAVGPAWVSIGAWYSSSTPLFLEAYDKNNNLLAVANGQASLGSSSFISVNAPGIAYAIVHDHSNFFTIDDVQIAVPLPSAFYAGLITLAGLGGYRLLVRHRAARH